MKGSGISEALQTVYGKDAVEYLMIGKAATSQPDNNIYDNNVRDVSEENGNINRDYYEEEN